MAVAVATGSVGPSQAQSVRDLPAPGILVPLSAPFHPPLLTGIKVHAADPLRFDFILDKGQSSPAAPELSADSCRLIKYFLTALTIPEKDFWVNLSPYERERVVPEALGRTEMGRDLLAQDYVLKQISASMLHPEAETGRKFWKRLYALAQGKHGAADIPVDMFNKVWIVPGKAVVYENGKAGAAYVTESRLRVMLQRDDTATVRNADPQETTADSAAQDIVKAVMREVLIPELEREVNEGSNFSLLRQVYQSMILATWYKKKVRSSLLSAGYVDRRKTAGVDIADPKEADKIWARYVEAFRKGVVNLVREEPADSGDFQVPRKYFSGGFMMPSGEWLEVRADGASVPEVAPGDAATIEVEIVSQGPLGHDGAMPLVPEEFIRALASPGALTRYLEPLLGKDSDRAFAGLQAAFPLLAEYFFPSPLHINYDLMPGGELVSRGDATLVRKLFERGVGRKIRGLAERDRDVFQDGEGLSSEGFSRLADKFRLLSELNILPHFMTAFLFHDIGKAGSLNNVSGSPGEAGDIRVPNTISVDVLRNSRWEGSGNRGLFENIPALQAHPGAAVLNEFFYELIAVRGYAGQWIRGEVTYEMYGGFTRWVRENFDRLKAVLAPGRSDAEAAHRISDIVYLFDVADVAAVREGLLTDVLDARFRDFFRDFRRTITPEEGVFRLDWDDVFNEQWHGLNDLSDKRAYLKARLKRFRADQVRSGERPESLERVVDGIDEKYLDLLVAGFRYFQGWYVESATSGLTPASQVKLLALSVALARQRGIRTDRPFHVNYFALMKQLSDRRYDFDYYKLRIVEAFLRQLSWEDVLPEGGRLAGLFTGAPENRVSPLLDLDMKIDGEKAISFDFNLTDEGRALLTLIRIYERRDSAKFHDLLKILTDRYGLRKDDFDRVSNEMAYLASMAEGQGDKERAVRHAKGPVVVEVGPAGGAVMGVIQKNREAIQAETVVGIDISEEALIALERKIAQEGWTGIRLVHGDAYKLDQVLKQEKIPAPDTIIFSSVLHEIYSYVERDGRKFNLESVRDILKEAVMALNRGGRLLIRDGVIPEDGEAWQLMEIYGEQNKELFDMYMRDFKGRGIPFELVSENIPGATWRIKIKRKDAMEFLYTLTWGAGSFPYEVREQYGVLTRDDYLAMIFGIGRELGIGIAEKDIPAEERSYLQEGYVTHLKGKAALFDLDGRPVRLPDSNMIIVIEKSSGASPDVSAMAGPGTEAARQKTVKDDKPFMVITDAHGTLLKPTWKKEIARAFVALTGISLEEALEWVDDRIVGQIAEKGKDVPPGEVAALLLKGMTERGGGGTVSDVNRELAAARKYYMQPENHEAMPGARECLRDLQGMGVPVMVVTGSDSELAYQQLLQGGFNGLIARANVYGQDRLDPLPVDMQRPARYRMIRRLADQMPDYRAIVLDDTPGSAQAVNDVDGVFVALSHGGGVESEHNMRRLRAAGALLEIRDESGWQQLVDMVRGLNAKRLDREDAAMNGGIDLDPGNGAYAVRHDDGVLVFPVDAALLQRITQSPGLTPRILVIHPAADVKRFLGLADARSSAVFRSP